MRASFYTYLALLLLSLLLTDLARAVPANDPETNLASPLLIDDTKDIVFEPIERDTSEIGVQIAQFQFSEVDVLDQVNRTISGPLKLSLANNIQFSQIEQEYPGLIDYTVNAMRPAMVDAYLEKLPLLWNNLGHFYSERFTPAEQADLLKFVGSSAAAELRGLASVSSKDTDKAALLIAIQDAGGKANESTTSLTQNFAENSFKTVIPKLSKESIITVFKFENSPVGQKFAQIQADYYAIQLQWDLYFPGYRSNEFAKVRGDAVTKFIADTDAKRATESATAIAE